MAAFALVGRDAEVARVRGLVDNVAGRGGALVVQGDAGIGKSCLLAEAGRHAADRGMRVLVTSGVQCEMHLLFAGLHQLLRLVLSHAGDLPAAQRGALFAAFGLTGDVAPDQFLIALAALDLLGVAAADSPVLLLIEDAQWLDRPTCDALAFAGRRLESEPIAALIAIRDGYESPLIEAGLPGLRLEGLAEQAAGALLDARAPDLAPVVRGRLLSEAAGNPLALVELPAALGSEQLSGASLLPTRLQLTGRLERAFAARVKDLPQATRTQLLLAAVNDRDSIAEVLRAAAVIDGANQAVDALGPAIAARLVDANDQGHRAGAQPAKAQPGRAAHGQAVPLRLRQHPEPR